jgi:hypothetical protein
VCIIVFENVLKIKSVIKCVFLFWPYISTFFNVGSFC